MKRLGFIFVAVAVITVAFGSSGCATIPTHGAYAGFAGAPAEVDAEALNVSVQTP